MKLVQENDDTLKASIAGVVELLGSTIAKTQADLELKVRETQAAAQTMHDHLAATATTTSPAAGAPEAPPGQPFSRELEALKRRPAERELNPSTLARPTGTDPAPCAHGGGTCGTHG